MEGHTVYTDAPCFSDAPPAKLPPINTEAAMPAPSAAELARRHDQRIASGKAARDKADAAFVKQQGLARAKAQSDRTAILNHQVLKGMSPQEVKSALGEPDAVEAAGTWLYHGNGERVTVSFDAGGVSRVASTPDTLSKKHGRSHRRKHP